MQFKIAVLIYSIALLSCGDGRRTGPAPCNEYARIAHFWIWPSSEVVKSWKVDSIYINATYNGQNQYEREINVSVDSEFDVYTAVSRSKDEIFPENVSIQFYYSDSIVDSISVPIDGDQRTMIYLKDQIQNVDKYLRNSIDNGCGKNICWVTENGSGLYECVD